MPLELEIGDCDRFLKDGEWGWAKPGDYTFQSKGTT